MATKTAPTAADVRTMLNTGIDDPTRPTAHCQRRLEYVRRGEIIRFMTVGPTRFSPSYIASARQFTWRSSPVDRTHIGEWPRQTESLRAERGRDGA